MIRISISVDNHTITAENNSLVTWPEAYEMFIDLLRAMYEVTNEDIKDYESQKKNNGTTR